MYVQAYSGSDTVGTGEVNSPVATLSKAVEIVNNDTEYDKARIVVGGGEYFADQKTVITNNKDELVIKAKAGETPTFIGGVSFKISEATPADATVKAKLSDQTAADNLYVIDLTTKVDIDDIPGINLPGAYSISWATESTVPTTEMFFDGKPMTVARYPNSEYMTVSSVVNEGAIPRNWEDDRIGTDEYVEESDRNKNDVMVIGYNDSRIDNWANATQALMFGYWKHDWATQTIPLASVNASAKTLTAKYPSYYGVDLGQRFYVYNLLEEIDMEKEYFIDRTTGKMYFYMPTGATADDEIHMSINSDAIITINNSSNVTVDGIKFSASRGKAIHAQNTDNLTVKNCEVSGTADTAISVSGTNNTIENCFIHDVNGGIYVSGGNRDTLTTGNNMVRNNEITRFARIDKVYTYAVSLSGVGNTATNNEMYDSEHTAVSFAGNNNIVSYNEIYDVCKEVDDAAAIYVGRTWTHLGNKVLYNYIHDLESSVDPTYPIAGIFFDDNYYTGYVEGNIFENIVGDGVRFNGGREHTVTNNIFVNCTQNGVSATDPSATSDFVTQINDAEKFLNNSVWAAEYKNTYTNLFAEDGLNYGLMYYPGVHNFTNNFASNCGGLFELGTESAKNVDTTGSKIEANDLFNGNFVNNGEIVGTYINGFKPIDFSKIGIKK